MDELKEMTIIASDLKTEIFRTQIEYHGLICSIIEDLRREGLDPYRILTDEKALKILRAHDYVEERRKIVNGESLYHKE